MPFSIDQYRAARQAAIVTDRSARGRLVVRGQDRKTFLHALLTNDVAMLTPGSGCYAALLTPQGRMVTDMRLFDLGDLTLLDVPAGMADGLLAKLDQVLFSEDVQLGDVSATFGCLSIQGPLSTGIVFALVGGADPPLAEWPQYRNARFERGTDTIIVARVDEYGQPGYLLFAARPLLPALASVAAGNGAVLADSETLEVLRLEAGVPEFPVDLTTDTIPTEAGIEARAVSYTKGCFPGQEVLVRIRDRGHGRIARRLVGLIVEGSAAPGPGDELRAGDTVVGHVTSAAFSPALGRAIALGYVQRDRAETGTRLTVTIEGVAHPAAIATLPFVE